MSETLSGTKIAVVGGCGHVGLPLGIKFALAGAEVVLVDVDAKAVERVNAGELPFLERGGEEQLARALALGMRASTEAKSCRQATAVVFVVGTPVDEHLNPKVKGVLQVWDNYAPHLDAGTCVIMRSTLYPGTMQHLYERAKLNTPGLRLAFCPERVAQGFALEEIDSLPQIVSAFDDESFEVACRLFRHLAPEIVRLTPVEAELAKLMANSWRYIEFAIANQFYLIAEESGVDFYRVFQAIRHNYPRAQGYKAPGFAAGPCLFKDTMQLASFFRNRFYMGHSAMLVNEGLANHVVDQLRARADGSLWGVTVGLLGLTFKANSDDTRESLAYKVKKGLEFYGARVLAHDPYLPQTDSLDDVSAQSDWFVLCTPHAEFRDWPHADRTIDVWNFYGKTSVEIFPTDVKRKDKA